LKIGSLLWILLYLCLLMLPAALIWGMGFHDPDGLRAAFILLVAIPVVGILQFAVASQVRCPLCHGPLLKRPQCAISAKARRVFGSLRTRVALGALLLGRIRCQYCGELSDTRRPRRRGRH
jgi:hypothetical protein